MYGNPSSDYLWLLRNHHRVTTEVYILDNARNYLADASSRLVSGTVDMDANGSVSRSAKLTLLDPTGSLGLDFSGSGSGIEYYNRMVRVVHRIDNFQGTAGFWTPVFTGPLAEVQRSGVTLELECLGMEALAQAGLYVDRSWPPGWARSAVIMDAISSTTGEWHFRDWSGGTQVLRDVWSMESGDDVWSECKDLADSMGMNLFYNGDGVCIIKPKSVAPIFIADSSWLTEEPESSFSIDNLSNVAIIEGATAPTVDGGEARIRYEAWPPPQHPYSPQALTRNGVPRIIPHFISDDSIKDWETLAEIGWNTLAQDLMVATEATAVIATAPFLEEFDTITIRHPKLNTNTMLTKWTMPLVGDSEMSLNFFSTSSLGNVSRTVSNTNASIIAAHPAGIENDSVAEKNKKKRGKKGKKRNRNKGRNKGRKNKGRR